MESDYSNVADEDDLSDDDDPDFLPFAVQVPDSDYKILKSLSKMGVRFDLGLDPSFGGITAEMDGASLGWAFVYDIHMISEDKQRASRPYFDHQAAIRAIKRKWPAYKAGHFEHASEQARDFSFHVSRDDFKFLSSLRKSKWIIALNLDPVSGGMSITRPTGHGLQWLWISELYLRGDSLDGFSNLGRAIEAFRSELDV
jgi:hypothetical protein